MRRSDLRLDWPALVREMKLTLHIETVARVHAVHLFSQPAYSDSVHDSDPRSRTCIRRLGGYIVRSQWRQTMLRYLGQVTGKIAKPRPWTMHIALGF